jgi:hypothetical protein
MNDLLKAFKTSKALHKDSKRKFEIKFRLKKSESESIALLNKHWKKSGVFHPDTFGKEPIQASEPLPDKLGYDSRLLRTRLGKFYLCLPLPLEIRSENQAPDLKDSGGIISIDPGVSHLYLFII